MFFTKFINTIIRKEISKLFGSIFFHNSGFSVFLTRKVENDERRVLWMESEKQVRFSRTTVLLYFLFHLDFYLVKLISGTLIRSALKNDFVMFCKNSSSFFNSCFAKKCRLRCDWNFTFNSFSLVMEWSPNHDLALAREVLLLESYRHKARTAVRGTQREYSWKPLEHSIVERILVFKR